MNDPQAQTWEGLREDLVLLAGPSNKAGAPTWTLQDPAAGRFYRIGWLEFEILKRWSLSNPQKIIQSIQNETLLKSSINDILEMYKFLKMSSLLRSYNKSATQNLMFLKAQKQQGRFFQRLVKNYLFFRISLIRPDALLDKTTRITAVFFQDIILKIILLCAFIGFVLVIRDFSAFISAFSVLKSPAGLISGFIALGFAKIIHELGHAMTCKHYGCRVPSMGVAFILMWPLLWTDTTDAWRLTDKKKRLAIDGAGMSAELALAAISSILWAISPEGTFKDAMHMLAGVTWIMTLFVNLNPFMRFDGYYLLSDALDVPNLQTRSFTLAKQWMRRTLWGMREQSSEHFTPHLKFWLILYAYGTWIYRFFLFLGIAFLVYHFFFKALGLTLLIVEIWWFIIKPILGEIKYWAKNKDKINMTTFGKWSAATSLIAVALLLFVPWQSTISTAAIIKSTQEIPLIAAQGAMIKKINKQSGDTVKKGDILFVLKSPDLSHAIKQAEQELHVLKEELRNKSVDIALYREATLIKDKMKKIISTLKLKKTEENNMVIHAPIDGILVDIPDHLKEGLWVSKKEHMGLLRARAIQIEAFITDIDLTRIKQGANALFYDSHNAIHTLKAKIENIDAYPSKHIPYPELSAQNGGDIAMKQGTEGLIPIKQHYKITLSIPQSNTLKHTARGELRISANAQSPFAQISRKITSIIIQESGI